MTPMKQLTIAIVIAGLGACVAPPEYQAADSYGYGYSERQLSNDQYRIHFRSRGDDTAQAMDYAMLRASELTLEKGFDWFDVGSRETLLDHESVSTTHPAVYSASADCELVACRESRRPMAKYQNTLLLGDERREVEVIMEIRMGNGLRPDSVAGYDAREVNAYLRDDTDNPEV